MRYCGFMAALALLGLFGAGAAAQEEPRPSVFRELFPKPSGLNGYEEIVLAGETCRDCPRMHAYWSSETEPTLSEKRAVLAEPAVRRGMELLRRGLAKPRTTLHLQVDSDTRFPELGLFRLLARVLMLEEVVRLADGRVSDAIDSFRDALRLGAACGNDLIISGLVQVAIDAIGLRVICDHFGQLSTRDCDKLLAVAREWLAEPDPTIAMLESEKRSVLASWEKARRDPNALLEMLAPPPDDSEASAENVANAQKTRRYREQVDRIAASGFAYNGLIDSVKARSAQRIDAQIANLQRPQWERPPTQIANQDSLVDYLADALVPAFDRFTERFAMEAATARLLGLNAAIRRYLWEYDRLPERLEDVHARDLMLDPFSGKAMVYKRTGERTYELYSEGAYERDADGSAIGATRAPITIPRKPH